MVNKGCSSFLFQHLDKHIRTEDKHIRTEVQKLKNKNMTNTNNIPILHILFALSVILDAEKPSLPTVTKKMDVKTKKTLSLTE